MRRLVGRTLFWLRERIRDALMWPINLVRDFPIRSRRLLHTSWIGVVAITTLPLSAYRALSRDSAWSRSLQGSRDLANWLHQLAAQIFDLVGGPEITQFLMHLITNTAPLTSKELALITSLLGPAKMRYHDVRVAEGGLLDLVFRFNGNLAFTTWHTIHFPRTITNQRVDHTRANLAIVVHELTHVYQYERVGSRYLGEAIYMLLKTKRDCYDYGLVQGLREAAAAGKAFCDFNREQQAQIVQDYFTLRFTKQDTGAYESFIKQLRAGEL